MNIKVALQKLWQKGSNKGSPRFCLSGYPVYRYRGKEITHYDFEWVRQGDVASISLYTAPAYGAVWDYELDRVVRLRYRWDCNKQTFRRF